MNDDRWLCDPLFHGAVGLVFSNVVVGSSGSTAMLDSWGMRLRMSYCVSSVERVE